MEKKPDTGKMTAWSFGAVIAFAAVYLVGGILLEKYGNKNELRKKSTP